MLNNFNFQYIQSCAVRIFLGKLSIHSFICLLIYLSIQLLVIYVLIHLFIYLFIHSFIHLLYLGVDVIINYSYFNIMPIYEKTTCRYLYNSGRQNEPRETKTMPLTRSNFAT